jgi:regulator of sigma E protease
MEVVKNLFGEEVGKRYMLGITRTDEVEYEKVSPAEALNAAFIRPGT